MNALPLHNLYLARAASCRACDYFSRPMCGLIQRRPALADLMEICVIGKWSPATSLLEQELYAAGVSVARGRADATQRVRRWMRRRFYIASLWLKYATRRDRPPAAAVQLRREKCTSCDQRRGLLGMLCGLCGCVWWIKAALASQACPHAVTRWLAMVRDGDKWKEIKRGGCGCNR